MKYFDGIKYLESKAATAVGYGYWEAGREELLFLGEASDKSLFDIASITKVAMTTLLLMDLAQKNEINLGKSATSYLSEFEKNINLIHLLTHTSGLPSWRPLYAILKNQNDFISYLNRLELENPPGAKRMYSDLGFILLGKLIEKIYNRDLCSVLKSEILEKHQLNELTYQGNLESSQAIPTSLGNPYEKKLTAKYGRQYEQWREYRLQGEVNDFNCAQVFGGLAGHCGLFSSVRGLLKLAIIIKEHPQYETFTKTTRKENALGFAKAEDVLKFKFSESTVGHHGFTGCSLFIDKIQQKILVVLTNRQFGGLQKNGEYPDWKKYFRLEDS
ncbi:MAG: beta-lactamase family protein [Halobacteriovoraceae bacterium]|nr:beta-lactamase family protein [Halobacteriovoraceae bacterium]MCB9094051.1 beta-lactamase family protein [Halobacteriovoraceae bacterium]